MDLNALKDFHLVAAHGGFGKASRASGRPKATLSRRVAELEATLGVQLIARGATHRPLTEAGELLRRRTEMAIHDVTDAFATVRDGLDAPRGLLRVAVPILFGQVAMGRLSARFRARHPDMQLEVVAADRMVDLVDDGFDVAIRTNPRPAREIDGRCFAKDRLVLAAAPSLPMPTGPQDTPFPAPAVVMPSFRAGTVWSVPDAGFSIAPEPALRLTSLMMLRDAIVEGAGVGLLPKSIIGSLVDQGRLVTWDVTGDIVELWALHTARRLQSPKVRAFLDFLDAQYPDGWFRAPDA